MVEILKALVLGVVQGVSEFVPVSSSGHLVLVPWLFGWDAPELLFDTVLHLGTLLALVSYFWADWWRLLTSWLRGLRSRDWSDPRARLMWWLLLGTAPAALAGFLLEDFFESLFGEPVYVAGFLLVTACLLLVSERLGRRDRTLRDVKWKDGLLIGLAQAVAITPGISRSGATISAGLLLGLERSDAARFSFLLSAPIILGAGFHQAVGAVGGPTSGADLGAMAVGFVVSAASGYGAIRLLLRYLQARRLYLFAFYCAWVGASSLIVALLRGRGA